MKRKETRIPFENIERAWNVRLIEDGSHLVDSICDIGLQQPIVVNGDNGTTTIIQGHLRMDGIRRIKEDFPEKFEALFGSGVPCVVITGASDRELALLHIDHGTITTLTRDYEIAVAFQRLFQVGLTQEDAANHMSALLDSSRPVKGERLIELRKIREEQGEVAYRQEYGKYRRGTTQFFHSLAHCPESVMDALRYYDTEELPDGVASIEELPRITKASVKKFYDGFLEDLKIKDLRGLPTHTRENPGPNFRRVWEEQVEMANDARNKTETRPKMWTGQKLRDQAKTLTSDGMRAACLTYAGDDIDLSLQEADALLQVAECLRDNDPELWQTCIVRATEITAEAKAKAEIAVAEQTQKQADEAAEKAAGKATQKESAATA